MFRSLSVPVLLAAAGTALLVAPRGEAADYSYMASAGDLRGMLDSGDTWRAVGYIDGVMDAMMRTRDFCVPDGTSAFDVRDRVIRMMSTQPRESLAPAADVIGVFLHADYPCTR
jgi:hypothetical protein